MKRLFVVLFLTSCVVACSNSMSPDHYVEIMSGMGCKGIIKIDSKEGLEFLSEQKTSKEEIQKFLSSQSKNTMTEISKTIADKVKKCRQHANLDE